MNLVGGNGCVVCAAGRMVLLVSCNVCQVADQPACSASGHHALIAVVGAGLFNGADALIARDLQRVHHGQAVVGLHPSDKWLPE